MAGTNESRNAPHADFDFAVHELEESERMQDAALRRVFETAVRPAAADECPGVDPYNTSGSFDRRNNWKRVGRR